MSELLQNPEDDALIEKRALPKTSSNLHALITAVILSVGQVIGCASPSNSTNVDIGKNRDSAAATDLAIAKPAVPDLGDGVSEKRRQNPPVLPPGLITDRKKLKGLKLATWFEREYKKAEARYSKLKDPEIIGFARTTKKATKHKPGHFVPLDAPMGAGGDLIYDFFFAVSIPKGQKGDMKIRWSWVDDPSEMRESFENIVQVPVSYRYRVHDTRFLVNSLATPGQVF